MSFCSGATLVDHSCSNLSHCCNIWKLIGKLNIFSQSIFAFFVQLKYKETYQNQMKGHYVGIGMDKRMLHAMKVGSLASNVSLFKSHLYGCCFPVFKFFQN